MIRPDLNILHYVGCQPLESKCGQIYYMINDGYDNYRLVIKTAIMECTLTESEMIDTVEQIFSEWAPYPIPKCSYTGKYIWKFGIGKRVLLSNTGPIMLGGKNVPWYKPWLRIENTQQMWVMMQTQKAKNRIAQLTYRGAGNTQYGNSLFYKGKEYDCPVIVSNYDKKYGVFKHPDFEKYGFNLKYE